eukprot:TRINITY_DN775838_c0_g1_i1.p1 TRINITY_DN775838_c0_g1~~TRINITY_DN775838_c0_g1_i1.p1  ORF type:complete len:266 (+),score=50.03 TRINITY_DN775838_c0_g1_i1:61-858(+)
MDEAMRKRLDMISKRKKNAATSVVVMAIYTVLFGAFLIWLYNVDEVNCFNLTQKYTCTTPKFIQGIANKHNCVWCNTRYSSQSDYCTFDEYSNFCSGTVSQHDTDAVLVWRVIIIGHVVVLWLGTCWSAVTNISKANKVEPLPSPKQPATGTQQPMGQMQGQHMMMPMGMGQMQMQSGMQQPMTQGQFPQYGNQINQQAFGVNNGPYIQQVNPSTGQSAWVMANNNPAMQMQNASATTTKPSPAPASTCTTTTTTQQAATSNAVV